MIERVGSQASERRTEQSDGRNLLGLRSGRSRKSRSLRRAGRVIPPNLTRPARSHYCPHVTYIGFPPSNALLILRIRVREFYGPDDLAITHLKKATLSFSENLRYKVLNILPKGTVTRKSQVANQIEPISVFF